MIIDEGKISLKIKFEFLENKGYLFKSNKTINDGDWHKVCIKIFNIMLRSRWLEVLSPVNDSSNS